MSDEKLCWLPCVTEKGENKAQTMQVSLAGVGWGALHGSP